MSQREADDRPETEKPYLEKPYVELVRRARAGDAGAFGELVGAFQDRAVGTAFGWVGDIELARDIAQEALTDAYRLLAQLDEPRAFPGWLRRIVVKHCDRATRGGKLAVVREEAAAAVASRVADPEQALADLDERERLRLAVAALPENERLPLVLHYFAGEGQPEIAEFLELPLSTIKKRLRTARARLREQGSEPMSEALERLRPSSSRNFSDTVKLYIALRAGDRRAVGALLDADPTLAEAEQQWDQKLTREGVLPFASRATPLITAVERGDAEMVTLLLERGALPDGACGCITGESALWAAVLIGRADLARKLLAAGADPNRLAATGNSPLHIASMRGNQELVDVLLAHGADPEQLDRSGRNAAAWASSKGHAEIPDRGTAEKSSEATRATGTWIETGIKALDLFVPLVRGARVRVPFRAGVGMVVLLGELCHRFAREGRAAVWTGFAQGPFDPVDLETEIGEAGLRGRVTTSVASASEGPVARRAAFERGLSHAETLCELEGLDVLLIIQSDEGHEVDVDASMARLARPSRGSLTTLFITPFANGTEQGAAAAWTELRPPFDAQIVLDRRRAKQMLLPSIHPSASLCRALSDQPSSGRASEEEQLPERHRTIAARARTLLESYEATDPELKLAPLEGGDEQAAQATQTVRARRLLGYLTQPFMTTEPFHGNPARESRFDQVLDDIDAILDGVAVHDTSGELGRRDL